MRTALFITCRYELKLARRYDSLVRKVLTIARQAVRPRSNLEIAVVFVGDQQMRQLNRRYRGKNKTTNVLAFETGDIFISFPEVKREAQRYGWTLRYGVARLALHGFLHILGYDHLRNKEAQKMEKIEHNILKNYA